MNFQSYNNEYTRLSFPNTYLILSWNRKICFLSVSCYSKTKLWTVHYESKYNTQREKFASFICQRLLRIENVCRWRINQQKCYRILICFWCTIKSILTPTLSQADTSLEEGERLVLPCSFRGIPPPTVTWTRNGGAVPDNAQVTIFLNYNWV